MQNSISVIIPSYNSFKTITYTIDGLLNQKGARANEIIIIDSSDKDGMDDLKRKYISSNEIKFISAGKRVIPSTGRNIGARMASGNLLVFLDSDVIPSDYLLDGFLQAYQNGCLSGGGSIEIPDFQKNKLLVSAQYYLQLNEYLPTGKIRIKPFLPGCNIYCDKEVFFRAGGFPELRASEDVIFGINVNKITKLWFIPNVKVAHIFNNDWKYFLVNQKLLGKYVGIYRKKESNLIIYKGINPLLLSPIFIGLKYFRIVPRIVHAGLIHIYQFVKVQPLFSLGILFWTIGFVQGCMDKKNRIKAK